MSVARSLAAPLLFALATLAALVPANARAQIPPPDGVIAGAIRVGTAGATTPTAVPVQLLALTRDGKVSAQETTSEGASFRFTAPADASVTYVLRVVYGGVQYFSDAVLLRPEAPTAQQDITVYDSTSEQPALSIESTTVTIDAVDRSAHQFSLVRQDIVRNPSDRAYIGGDGSVTLRLPLPDGVAGADIQDEEGKATVEGSVLAASKPLRPGRTGIVTRYVVGYDPQSGGYRLRVTAPLPTDRVEIDVPDRFVDAISPAGGAIRGADTTIEGERALVVTRSAAAEGDSAIVALTGLSGPRATNPLTEPTTAGVALLVAVVVLVGAVYLGGRLLPHRVDTAL